MEVAGVEVTSKELKEDLAKGSSDKSVFDKKADNFVWDKAGERFMKDFRQEADKLFSELKQSKVDTNSVALLSKLMRSSCQFRMNSLEVKIKLLKHVSELPLDRFKDVSMESRQVEQSRGFFRKTIWSKITEFTTYLMLSFFSELIRLIPRSRIKVNAMYIQ